MALTLHWAVGLEPVSIRGPEAAHRVGAGEASGCRASQIMAAKWNPYVPKHFTLLRVGTVAESQA